MARSREAARERVGGKPLRLLADPVSVGILREIGGEAIGSDDLIARTSHASRSTHFNRLRQLEAFGVLARETLASVPRRTRYQLTQAGLELLPVAERIEAWVCARSRKAGGGPAAPPAPVAVRALATGWDTEIVHRLGEYPRSLTELSSCIDHVGYHRLRHALRGLCSAELVAPARGRDGNRPYRLTGFARRATAAIAAAMRWEERHGDGAASVPATADIEALFLLPAPLIELAPELGGTCTLCVEGLGRVRLRIQAGRVVSWVRATEAGANWASGTRLQWRAAFRAGSLEELRTGGDPRLAKAIIAGLRPHLG